MESIVNFSFKYKIVFYFHQGWIQKTYQYLIQNILRQLVTTSNYELSSQSSWTRIWLPKMTIRTVNIFDKFQASFLTYWINFGLIQNSYQIHFLFSLEKNDRPKMLIRHNVVRYVSNSWNSLNSLNAVFDFWGILTVFQRLMN